MNYGDLHMYQAPMIYFQVVTPTLEELASLRAALCAEGQHELAAMLVPEIGQ